jgi:hypothetical protein
VLCEVRFSGALRGCGSFVILLLELCGSCVIQWANACDIATCTMARAMLCSLVLYKGVILYYLTVRIVRLIRYHLLLKH